MKLKQRFTIICLISACLFLTKALWLPTFRRRFLQRSFGGGSGANSGLGGSKEYIDPNLQHQRMTSNIQPHAGHGREARLDIAANGFDGHNAASLSASLAQSLANDPLDKDFMPAQDGEKFDHVEHVRRWEDHLDDLSRSAREQADKRAAARTKQDDGRRTGMR